MNPETYVQKALAGDFGQTARVDAEGAITDAVDRGYDDDAERVAATLDAMRATRGDNDMSDAELVARIMETDDAPRAELEVEAARRWGPNATEYTAHRCTGGKYIPGEIAAAIRQDVGAATTWIAVAKGELDPLAVER